MTSRCSFSFILMYLVLYFLTFPAMGIINSNMELSYAQRLEKGWSSVINHNHRQPAVTFPLTAIPLTGLYNARVKLGNPPKEFRVLVDSGSDLLWIPCNGCKGCPRGSLFDGREVSFFDPQQSSTASVIGCLDKKCIYSDCSSNCSYAISYDNGDTSKGYLVSDELHFSMMVKNKWTANSSIRILFGCSTFVSGTLTSPYGFYDGILGLSSGSELSVLSQLSSAGVSPKVFSHCLSGSEDGGGTLVFGEAVEPGITYTQLSLSKSPYYVHLQNIVVNGQPLDIDPSMFKLSDTPRTIVDSGTELVLLPEEVQNRFFNAIYSSVKPSQVQLNKKSNQCFDTNDSIYEAFPSVTMKFADGAIMELDPSNYLEYFDTLGTGSRSTWCIAWLTRGGDNAELTILGDIVLKDKIIVYDLINQRLGWKNYNCSLPINVTTNIITNKPTNNGHDSKESTMSKYVILGGSVGIVVVIVVAIGVVIIHYFRQ